MSCNLSVKSSKRNTTFRFGEHYDPIRALGIEPEENKMNFGVELEIGFSRQDRYEDYGYGSGSYHPSVMQAIHDRVGGYCITKPDCGAIEIVSVPLSFSDMKIYLQSLLGEKLPKVLTQNSGWGMHIHVSSAKCKGENLTRMVRFMTNQDRPMQEFLSWVANRSVRENTWAAMPSFEEFVGYSYRRHRNLDRAETGRYGLALNTGHETHEFRLFKTTTKADIACANLDFVRALVLFTRTPRPVDTERLIASFKNYVFARPKSYPHLVKRLEALQGSNIPATA